MKPATIESTIKTDEGGFNNLPSRKELAEAIQAEAPTATFVDSTELKYWENCEDTVVVSVNAQDGMAVAGVYTVANQKMADEVDAVVREGKIIIRMWWD